MAPADDELDEWLDDGLDDDVHAAIAWRHERHRHPELSGAEVRTAAAVVDTVDGASPDRVVTGLGGHGVAVVFDGDEPGPTVLFRAELDALPIDDDGDVPHRSETSGLGHQCGHDGHMAVLVALAWALGRRRPASGRVVLLFQPAEETGAGAAAVLADPAFADLRPDFAFAFHNDPGRPLGEAGLAAGPVHCASRGMRITLSGRTSHASEPGAGVSPAAAVARLIGELPALGAGGPVGPDYSLVTLTHAVVGGQTFGVAPGSGEVWVTLRTLTDDVMGTLVDRAESVARRAASEHGLGITIEFADVFRHCDNAPGAVDVLARSLDAEGVPRTEDGLPMLASEDFGLFGDIAEAAMVHVGAGVDHPPLHRPEYDFPDALIEPVLRVFRRVVDDLLG